MMNFGVLADKSHHGLIKPGTREMEETVTVQI